MYANVQIKQTSSKLDLPLCPCVKFEFVANTAITRDGDETVGHSLWCCSSGVCAVLEFGDDDLQTFRFTKTMSGSSKVHTYAGVDFEVEI